MGTADAVNTARRPCAAATSSMHGRPAATMAPAAASSVRRRNSFRTEGGAKSPSGRSTRTCENAYGVPPVRRRCSSTTSLVSGRERAGAMGSPTARNGIGGPCLRRTTPSATGRRSSSTETSTARSTVTMGGRHGLTPAREKDRCAVRYGLAERDGNRPARCGVPEDGADVEVGSATRRCHEPVAALEPDAVVEPDKGTAGSILPHHDPDMDSPRSGTVAAHELVARLTEEPALREPPVERELEGLDLLRHGCGVATDHAIEGGAVTPDHGRDVGGRAEPPLDLERGDRDARQPVESRIYPEVPRREEIPVGKRHNRRVGEPPPFVGNAAEQAVGFAAGLGAPAPVTAPPSYRGREEALPRPGITERTVREDLEFYLRHGRGDRLDLGERELAGEHDPSAAQIGRSPHPVGRVDSHLGRGVERQVGHELAGDSGDPHVLDEDGVRARRVASDQVVRDGFELAVGYERVHRDIDPDVAGVGVLDGGLERSGIETSRGPRPEPAAAEIDRVRARGTGGLERAGRSGRREQFRHGAVHATSVDGRRIKPAGRSR